MELIDEAFDALDWIHTKVDDELIHAIEKHTIFRTPLNPEMHPREAFIILAEEVGEVARALTYDEGDEDKLHDELIQVAAMASAMAVAVALRRLAKENE